MLKLEFKEATPVLLVLVALMICVAIIGTNPLTPTSSLDLWTRIGIGAVAVGFLVLLLVHPKFAAKQRARAGLDSEYMGRFDVAQIHFSEITPEERIIGSATIQGVKFDVTNENILNSASDVVVSSDDNHFGARGGVAKAILSRAGERVRRELNTYGRQRFRQGHVAITSGGDWGRRAILHPVVIDVDERRYPDVGVITSIIRRCLSCCSALGAESIAFPVLGGGTASKDLRPSQSVRAIIAAVKDYFASAPEEEIGSLRYVVLYVFDRSDAEGIPSNLDLSVSRACQNEQAHNKPAGGYA